MHDMKNIMTWHDMTWYVWLCVKIERSVILTHPSYVNVLTNSRCSLLLHAKNLTCITLLQQHRHTPKMCCTWNGSYVCRTLLNMKPQGLSGWCQRKAFCRSSMACGQMMVSSPTSSNVTIRPSGLFFSSSTAKVTDFVYSVVMLPQSLEEHCGWVVACATKRCPMSAGNCHV